jgi:hypothetical protein
VGLVGGSRFNSRRVKVGPSRVYQVARFVSIMKIARLVGMAPHDERWAEIVDETGDLVDATWANLGAA